MIKRLVAAGMDKMQKEMRDKLDFIPPGKRKDEMRQIIEDFLPAFKKALEDGDVSKLLKLKQQCEGFQASLDPDIRRRRENDSK